VGANYEYVAERRSQIRIIKAEIEVLNKRKANEYPDDSHIDYLRELERSARAKLEALDDCRRDEWEAACKELEMVMDRLTLALYSSI
jgi:hypothetical protein